MKVFQLLFLGALIAFCQLATAQTLPTNITVKNLDNETVSTETWENDGKPMIISFWATWCKPCILELSNIHDEYPDWVDETGVKLIAVSIDDARNAPKVRPFANGKGWEYDIFIDENSDLKRAMNVVNIPHTFLLDGDGNIVYSHNSYAPGDELELYEKVLELVE